MGNIGWGWGIVVGLLLLPLCVAQIATDRPAPVMLGSPPVRWQELGTITESQAYPAVGARTYSDVTGLAAAKRFIWNVEAWGRRAMLSFQTTADADSTTILLLGFADPCMVDQYGELSLQDDAVYLGQLVLTGGTQTGSHDNVYVDTIVATDGAATFGVLDSATDRRCLVTFTMLGCKTIVGIASTLQAGSTLYAYGRLYQ